MDEEQASRVAYLVAGYIRHTLTEREHDELDEWIIASDDNQKLFEELTDPENIQVGLNKMKGINVDAARERVKSKIRFTDEVEVKVEKKKRWIPYGVAASVIVLAGLVLFFMLNKKPKTVNEQIVTSQIEPGGNHATLTLADGRKINLGEAKNGLIDSTNGNEVLKTTDGQISYENGTVATKKYHVLTTPAGGQYNVVLPDGSRVWLNSSSSLRYPVGFSRNERVVELSGEGYFEVAKEKAADITGMELGRRFVVKLKNGSQVEVLGTHFNIMAYDDEKNIQATLIEGSVTLRSATMGSTMSPGYQSTIVEHGFIETKANADTSMALAWKNGMFQFKDANIEDVMRQVARWYNVEIVYEGKPDQHFNATIYRKEPVEKLLDYLEQTNEVHFKVEGRKIVVMK